MKKLTDYISESLNKTPRYKLRIAEIQGKTRYLQFDDQYSDSKNDLFLEPDGTIYARNNSEFSNLNSVIKALGYDGEVVTGIEDPISYGKKLVNGEKLYKQLKPGKYVVIGDEYPFAKTYKISKL